MAELGDVHLGLHDPEIDKVKVDIEMLDYYYVNKCDSVEKLRAVLKVLLSGKEGRYPHLEKTVTDKLISLLPTNERGKIQALRNKPSIDELKQEQTKLNDWLKEMDFKGTSQEDSDCQDYIFVEKDSSVLEYDNDITLPPPRNNKKSVQPMCSDDMLGGNKKIKNASISQKSRLCKEKMSNRDYFRAWDKIDIESLENEIDGEDKEIVEEPVLRDKKTDVQEKKLQKRLEKERQELQSLRQKINTNSLTKSERVFMANIEKCKGNEFFKNEEFQDAVSCYTKSIALDDSNPILYANRAMASIRLDNLEQAVLDCTKALHLDPAHTKALARRGMVHHKRGHYKEATDDFQKCIENEPENKHYLQLMKCSEKKLIEVEGDKKFQKSKKKIIIQEVTEEDDHQQLSQHDKKESEDIEEIFTPGALEIAKNKEREKSSSSAIPLIGEQDKPTLDEDQVFYKVEIIEDDSESDNENDNESDSESQNNGCSENNVKNNNDIKEENSTAQDSETSDEYKKRGNLAMGEQKYDEALYFYTKAIEKDQNNFAAINNRALAFLKLKKGKEAEIDVNKCLQLDPNNIKAIFRRGLARKMQGCPNKIHDACNDFRHILEFEPQNKSVVKEISLCKSKLKNLEIKKLKSIPHDGPGLPIPSNIETKMQHMSEFSNEVISKSHETKSVTSIREIKNDKSKTKSPIVSKAELELCGSPKKNKRQGGVFPPIQYEYDSSIGSTHTIVESASDSITSKVPLVPKTTSELESSIRGIRVKDKNHLLVRFLEQFTKKDIKRVR